MPTIEEDYIQLRSVVNKIIEQEMNPLLEDRNRHLLKIKKNKDALRFSHAGQSKHHYKNPLAKKCDRRLNEKYTNNNDNLSFIDNLISQLRNAQTRINTIDNAALPASEKLIQLQQLARQFFGTDQITRLNASNQKSAFRRELNHHQRAVGSI